MSGGSIGFREAMSQYPTGVAVVAMADPAGVRAMTVGSLASVSLEPALVLFCVGRVARMASLFRVGGLMSVNVLRADQQALSTYFAGGWKEKVAPPHRFVPWALGARLEGSALSLAAVVVQVVEAGDHVVVVAEVGAIHRGLGPIEPLVFFDRQYHRVGGVGETAPELDAGDSSARLFHEPW